MTRRVGLLHTVPALAGTFDAALAERAGGVAAEHLVDAWLLQTAIESGVTAEVRERVARHVRTLADDGAEAILVTCSSIGEAADEAARAVSVPVLRVDRPMAREAVRLATADAKPGRPGRIAVLATLEATLGPTGRLIEAEVAAAGAPEPTVAEGAAGAAGPAGAAVEVTSEVVTGAAAARAAGDQAQHDALIRRAVEQAAHEASVIVLAQASMAAAVPADLVSIPVLTSPASGLAALVAAL